MNSVEKLIQELCPDGVKFVKLGEVCEIGKGVQFNKTDMLDDGLYPVINGGINPSGYINSYNQPANTITISQGGASAGYVNFITSNFWAGGHCYVLKPKNEVLNRYLYHFAKHNEDYFQQCQYGAGIPALSKNTVANLELPLPPLAIQSRIVEILDNFSSLTAELQARRSQYEYYRNHLLSFDGYDNIQNENNTTTNNSAAAQGKTVKWVKLGDVAKCFSGATPDTKKIEYWENGNIPWMSSGEVNNRQIWDTEKKITQKGFDNCSTKYVPANTVVIALAGQGKTRGMVAITRIELCTNQSLCAIVANDTLNSEYLYHYLMSKYKELRRISSCDGTRGGLNLKMINNFEFPLPSLSEQRRIADILDRFEALTTDLQSGLPAEIQARQQQYEYYRNKLLTFERCAK